MTDLQTLGVVSLDALVPRPIEPIPNSNQLPFDWECPFDPPGIMPRIQNLFDLECMCQDGKPDAEFWQWAAVAAAKDLGVFVPFGEWRAALTHLKARRTTEWSLLQYADADLAICTEVNLFLSRTLKESEMVAKATATKKATKAPTRETDDELLAYSLGFLFGPGGRCSGRYFEDLQEHGATDEQLVEAIETEWASVNNGSVRPYAVAVGQFNLSIYFDRKAPEGNASLWHDKTGEGPRPGPLLAKVREVLGIKDTSQPATKAKKAKKASSDDRPPQPAVLQLDHEDVLQRQRDEVLRRLCCATPAAAMHWQDLRGNLSADGDGAFGEVYEYLREIWANGFPVVVPGSGCGYASSKMGPPIVWFDQTDSKGSPSLSGDALIDEVRRVMKLDNAADQPTQKPEEPVELSISDEISQFPVAKMTRSPYQTRQDPPAAWLQELADTMERDTQLMPCLVRPNGEIIAGHTRHAAAKLLGWPMLQVRIVTCDDTTARRLVLLENAKRRDLTEREKCEAYGALMDTYAAQGRTQLELAKDLGLSESALSNNLRLRSLPEEIWTRHAAGGFSTDQLRKIATYGDRPKFCQGLLNYLTSIMGKQIAQPEPHHFESAYQRGVNAAFRPMGKNAYGEGCQFKPTAEQRKALDIVEVELFGHKHQMAGNVELWNKLNKEAKAKKKDGQSKDPGADPKQQKAAQKAQDDRRKECRRLALANCWDDARGCAIAARFQKPKKSDFNFVSRLRMIICEANGRFSKWEFKVDELTADDAAFADKCARDVAEFFVDPDELNELEPGLLEGLTQWIKVDPVPHWKPSEDLLTYCDERELKAFADDCDLPADIKANDLIDELLKNWPVGWVPDQFCLQKKGGK